MVDWAVVLGRAAQAALYGSRSVVLGPAICSSSNIDYGEEGKEQAGAMGRKGKSRAAPWGGREGEEQGGAMDWKGRSRGTAAEGIDPEKQDERVSVCRVASVSPDRVAPAGGTRDDARRSCG